MHHAVFICSIAMIAACDRQAPAPAPTPAARAVAPSDPMLVAVPANPPPGPYTIKYDCFHSDMPWGKGEQFHVIAFDLAAKQRSDLSYTTDDPDKLPGPPPPPPPPKLSPISPEQLAKLQAAIAKVLHGGPYRRELPPSEGSPCTLTLAAGSAPPFFTIEKAFTAEHDAVNDLIHAF